jgi:hypothetical protein
MNVGIAKPYPKLAWRESFGVAETPAEYVFHRPKLYLETTIPSYLTARPSRNLVTARLQRATAQWWDSWRTQFEIYVSDVVFNEASDGDPDAAQRRLDIIAPFPQLESNNKSRTLAWKMIETCKLSQRALADAEHAALAAIHKMDFLLSWNCAHLVNPNIRPKIESVCHSAGYSCPALCTPTELMELYEHAH